LEIQISSLLDKTWKDVYNTASYFDTEENKLRDIDIVASNVFTPKISYEPNRIYVKKLEPIELFTNLVVECKKSEKFAWVFFTRPYKLFRSSISGQYIDSVQIREKKLDEEKLMNYFFEKTNLHYGDLSKVAIAYSEFCLEKPKNSQQRTHKKEIFEAQNQLKKYIDSQNNDIIGIAPYNFTKDFFIFYFLCIVVDGRLYEAKVDSESLDLNQTKHIVLKSEYRPNRGLLSKTVLIDIVERNYFEEYLTIIKKDELSLRENTSLINTAKALAE
jgi:hypothetical protein